MRTKLELTQLLLRAKLKMYDLDTIQAIKHSIEKRKQETIEHLVYGVDNIEQLNYAKGKISAYNALLQDLTDLQKNEE